METSVETFLSSRQDARREILTFGDIRLTSQRRPGLSGKGEKAPGQSPMNRSKQGGYG